MRADMRTSVENEWLCAQLVEAFGLPIAACEMAMFEDQKALVVERFDRRVGTRRRLILRLPQEDFARAMGMSSLAKYQADGGPGIADIMAISAGPDAREVIVAISSRRRSCSGCSRPRTGMPRTSA